MPEIATIYRYPVKGLGPDRLDTAELAPGQTIAGDRLYAIENGPTGFDPAHPAYLPKSRFLMLMRNERLAALHTAFDQVTHTLAVAVNGREAARGDLRTPEGRRAIEEFFTAFCAGELRGPPKVLHGADHSFSDVARKVVSIINLASVADLETILGVRVHPLRFRANLYFQGWPAWSELDFVGRELALGRGARVKVVKRITRCAATNVDPDTGVRDLHVPETLMRNFNHIDCGIYAEVIAGGLVACGDQISADR